MQLGMIGLGRMGANIVRRLMRAGHTCVVYDRDPKPGRGARQGGRDRGDIAGGRRRQARRRRARSGSCCPRARPTESTIEALVPLLSKGDTIIDGGNTFWRDDIRRGKALAEKGLHYLDVGTSGGVWGLERGYCLMIGGDADAVKRLDPIFSALAPGKGAIPLTPGRDDRDPRVEQGYMHAGPCGAGHFVKMVHNGIEYGLMQAYAEGFDILRNADAESVAPEHRFTFDLADVAEVWRRGSVVTSWLLDLTANALAQEEQARIPIPASSRIPAKAAGRCKRRSRRRCRRRCFRRRCSRASARASSHTFAEKIISAMRKGFGGHVEPKKG